MRTIPLIIVSLLLIGQLPLNATTPSNSPKTRAEQAALEAATAVGGGLHLILVQDDGKHEPFASVVVTIELAGTENELSRRVVNGESKIEIFGRGIMDSSRIHLTLSATIEAKIDFGGSRAVKGGSVGRCIVDRTEFKSERLRRGEPHLFVLNSLASEEGEHFSESAALILLWK